MGNNVIDHSTKPKSIKHSIIVIFPDPDILINEKSTANGLDFTTY